MVSVEINWKGEHKVQRTARTNSASSYENTKEIVRNPEG